MTEFIKGKRLSFVYPIAVESLVPISKMIYPDRIITYLFLPNKLYLKENPTEKRKKS